MGVVRSSIAPTCSKWEALVSYGNMLPVNMAGVVLREIMEKWAAYEHRLMSKGLVGDVAHFGAQAGTARVAKREMLQIGDVGAPAKKKSKPNPKYRMPTTQGSGRSNKFKRCSSAVQFHRALSESLYLNANNGS